MTPEILLEEVKERFIVLYYDYPEKLELLLRRALGKFQDKAGVVLELWLDDPEFQCPPHFQAIAAGCDSKRRHVAWRLKFDEDGNRYIGFNPTSRHEAPFCLYYFANLRGWPLKEDLPKDVPPLLADYLEALIAVPNTNMERWAYLQSGRHEAAQALLSEQELRQRIADLENEMEACKAFIPPASMF